MNIDAKEKAAAAWRAFAEKQRRHASECEERARAIRDRLQQGSSIAR